MEISFGFALLAYYTWWILSLVVLIIIIYKLVTQQNFQVSLQVGINLSGQNTSQTSLLLNLFYYVASPRNTSTAKKSLIASPIKTKTTRYTLRNS